MKKYFFLLYLMFPVFLSGQVPVGLNLTADKSWADPDIDWRAHGTAFYNYNGDIYTAAYTVIKVQTFPSEYTAYPYFYKCYATTGSSALSPVTFGGKAYIDYFGYLGETGAEHEAKIMGHNFFFEFNGDLWYYQHVHSNLYNKSITGLVDESFACFAKMPTSSSSKWTTSTIHFDPAMDHQPMGGVQLDSLLILFCVDEESSSSTYHQWYLQTYKYSNGKFSYVGENRISSIPGDKFGGIVSRQGNSGPMLILNTYSSTSYSSYLGMLLPGSLTNGIMTFTYIKYNDIPTLANVGACTLLSGSIRGQRPSTYTDLYPTFSERVSVLAMSATTTSGNYTLGYMEYLVSNDWLDDVTFGTMAVPSSFYPHKDDSEFNIEAGFGLILSDFSGSIPGKDGYQRYNWVFYPNSSGNIAGVGFESDKWLANPSSLIYSDDLADTAYYGQDIKSLWSLIGIVEGAPPAVIDWEVWDNLHTFEYKPTNLLLEQISTNDTNTTTTCSYGGSFTQGAEISMEYKKAEAGFGSSVKYSKVFGQKTSVSTVMKEVISQEFELSDISQEYGAFIYAVPEIYRFNYSVYPWYDEDYAYPVHNSLQYFFMVNSMSLRIEKAYFDQWPFYIDEPGAEGLLDWKAESRPDFFGAVEKLTPVGVSWSDGFKGSKKMLRTGSDSTSSYSYDYGYEREYSASAHIPTVFTYNISVGEQIDFSSDVEVRTGFGNSIEVSLENMVHSEDGVDMEYLTVNTYLLKPENNVTGYLYDELDGQKPWYIGYLVGNCWDKIRLVAPAPGACLEQDEMLFNWEADNGGLGHFILFINSEPYTSPQTTLYEFEAGAENMAGLSGFTAEKGRTYYWQVRGTAPNGEVVWSEPSSFQVSCDQPGLEPKGLVALAYPNPGDSRDLMIAVDPVEEGKISVRIVNVNGQNVATREVSSFSGEPVNIAFGQTALPSGMYFAVISSGNEQVVRKVMIK